MGDAESGTGGGETWWLRWRREGRAGAGRVRSAPALNAAAVADVERSRRRLGSMSVPDAAGTGRSGREASPEGPTTAAAMALSAPSEVGLERTAQRERA